MPKDVLTYIAGLTTVKPLRFFTIATLGRLPALFASSYMGYTAHEGNYLAVIILLAAAILLFLVSFVFQDKIKQKLSNLGR
jgi:uncharacterized membrane protein YdjX (TVP38/TMEM64 family)